MPKTQHSFLPSHFIKKAVIARVKAGNPGRVNSMASKRPHLGKGQSWSRVGSVTLFSVRIDKNDPFQITNTEKQGSER